MNPERFKGNFPENDDLSQPPPNDTDAERGLLGSFLIEPSIIDRYSPRLSPDDFYSDANRRIFAVLNRLRDDGIPGDVIVLVDRLRSNGEIEAVGGEAAIYEIMSACHTITNADHYAGIIAEKSLRRRLLAETGNLRAAVLQGDSPAVQLLSRWQQSLELLVESTPRKTLFSAADLTTESLSLLDRIEDSPIATGYEHLDETLGGGFRPKSLVVIGARPRGGKTVSVVNLMQNICIGAGVPGVFFSLEMTATEIYYRLLSNESGVYSSKLGPGAAIRGQLTAYDMGQIIEAGNRLAESPFWIDDRSGASVSEIASTMRLFHRKHGARIFFIDYAGIVNAELPDRSIREQIGGVAVAFKRIAKELSVIVVLLAQANRDSATVPKGTPKREKLIASRPRLEHLKESSGLEENADVVILIHRPELLVGRTEAAELEIEGYVEWIVAKNRNGRQGEIPMHFSGEFVRFEECDGVEITEEPSEGAGDPKGQPGEDNTGTEQQRTFNDEF